MSKLELESPNVKKTILRYFEGINRGGWESYIGDDMVFTVFSAPRERGKAAYLEATKRFLQIAKSVEIKKLIIENHDACLIVRYKLQSPKRNASICDITELFSVKEGKMTSSTIFFDTSALSAFISPFIASYHKELL